ncbi:hypothetical protein [Reyranella soli]|uniref:DUF2147 domain-containing protein n=1 Tax=Reyranella soli TaxID=1230389 RepID=A0A512NG07_9HYPH|nr:hypothetical protein [Reyranella soli]GEP57881.1 hypothetical protein RSO01_50470 [Reyranella soli]
MHRFVLVCALAYIASADVGLAQTATSIQGNWVTKTGDCGDLKLRIASQSRSGAITGTMECVRTGQVTRFGEQLIAGKQMSGKFDGTLLNIEGPQSLTSVKLAEDRKLVGFAYGGPGLGTTPVAFVKQ